MGRSEGVKTLPPGRPPWDAWNGLRVGLLAGFIIALLPIWLAGWDSYWLALVGAVVGGAVGYLSQRRKLARVSRKADFSGS